MQHVDQQHHKTQTRRVGGVGKSQHVSDSHVPFQQHTKDGSRAPPSHSHSTKVSRQSFHVTSSEGSGGYSSSVVNSRVVPSKKYATPISDHAPTERPHNAHQQSDYYSQQVSANDPPNDPGDRVPPSGASSPSSTPNSTLGKIHHMQVQQEMLQSSHSDSRLLRTDSQSSADSGMASLETSKSDVILYQDGSAPSLGNGSTKGLQNAINAKHSLKTPGVGKEREKQSSSSLASVYNKYHPGGDGSANVGGEMTSSGQPRVLHHPIKSGMTSVAARAAMFNLNLNNSGNAAATASFNVNSPGQQPLSLQGSQAESPNSSHHSSPSKSSSKGVKTPSPKTTARSPETANSSEFNGYSSHTGETGMTENDGSHANVGGMDSRSSSIEELSQINVEEKEAGQSEGEEDTDGGRHGLIVKPEATKSTAVPSQQHMGGAGGYIKQSLQGPPPPGYPSSSAPSSSMPQQAPPPSSQQQQQHAHHHPPSHHHGSEAHHPPPPPYPQYIFTPNLSQTGLSQNLSQGAGGQSGLPPPPNYQPYEQHYPGRGEMSMYPPPPPPPTTGGKYGGRGGVGVPRPHHHISPPHGSQQYEQQPPLPYTGAPGAQQQQTKHQSVGYKMSHDARPGMHMMGGGQPIPPHMLSHDIPLHHRTVPYHLSSNVVALAHEATGKGDINALVSWTDSKIHVQHVCTDLAK